MDSCCLTLARCVFNHSRFGSVRFANGDGLSIQSRGQCRYPHTADIGNNLLPHPGLLLSEDGDITPLKVLFRKGWASQDLPLIRPFC